MKDDGWRMKGVLLKDWRMDRQTDIGDYRITFATDDQQNKNIIPTSQATTSNLRPSLASCHVASVLCVVSSSLLFPFQ